MIFNCCHVHTGNHDLMSFYLSERKDTFKHLLLLAVGNIGNLKSLLKLIGRYVLLLFGDDLPHNAC